MVRARVRGESGFYHAGFRSAGRIALFEDDEDRREFLRILRRVRERRSVRILAWCLMTDHVHFVVDVGGGYDTLSLFMHDVAQAYATYFNARTNRVGRLLQGPFWSVPIDGEAQLFSTIRYVHMNPERAGISSMATYRWSSYQEYLGRRWVVDQSTLLDVYGSIETFDECVRSDGAAVWQPRNSVTDERALSKAMELADVRTSSELRALGKDDRDRVMLALVGLGCSIRKVARVFGVGHSTVQRVLYKVGQTTWWDRRPRSNVPVQ